MSREKCLEGCAAAIRAAHDPEDLGEEANILAEYLFMCLQAYREADKQILAWKEMGSYGKKVSIPLNLEEVKEEKPPPDPLEALMWNLERGARYAYRKCNRCGMTYDFYKKGTLFFYSAQCKCNGMKPENINRVSESLIRSKLQWLRKND